MPCIWMHSIHILYTPIPYTHVQCNVSMFAANTLCDSVPCLHGGACQGDGLDLFTCICIPGWQGETCGISKLIIFLQQSRLSCKLYNRKVPDSYGNICNSLTLFELIDELGYACL